MAKAEFKFLKKGKVDVWSGINTILLIAVVTFAVTAVGTALYYSSGRDAREPEFVPHLDTDVVVVINPNVFNRLSEAYKNSVIEMVYCLYGEKTGKEITIWNIKEELVIDANETQAKTAKEFACQSPGVIGTLHFHLPQFYHAPDDVICEPSLTDAYTFGTLATKGEGHIVQGIQCGADKFAFFDTSIGGHNAFDPKSYKWRVG